jgi:hypothetical protein
VSALVISLRAAMVVILLLAVAVAACGGSGGAATSPTPSVCAEPSAASSTVGGQASPPPGAADPEALIPDTVGDVALQKMSMQGNEFANSASASAEAQEFLRNLGVSPDDVSVAIGFGLSADSCQAVAVFAFRAVGADSGQLMEAMRQAIDAKSHTPLTWESATVGGKSVQRTSNADRQGMTYLYVTGDLLIFVATTNEADAAEVLAGMP